MKIDIEADHEWPFLLIGFMIGAAFGMIFVVIVNNDAMVEFNYRKYKVEHPNSLITLEDYKRLKR